MKYYASDFRIPGHLGLISMLTGRKIRWNVAKEEIIGDGDAGKLLSREYRSPWKLGRIASIEPLDK